MSTPFTFKITITCPDTEYMAIIETGVTTIVLKQGCRARSPYFTIPVYEQGNTDTAKRTQLEAEINLNEETLNIWTTSDELKRIASSALVFNQTQKHLNKISELPLGHLQAILDDAKAQNNQIKFQDSESTNVWKIITLLVCGTICVILLIILFARVGYPKVMIQLRNKRRFLGQLARSNTGANCSGIQYLARF